MVRRDNNHDTGMQVNCCRAGNREHFFSVDGGSDWGSNKVVTKEIQPMLWIPIQWHGACHNRIHAFTVIRGSTSIALN